MRGITAATVDHAATGTFEIDVEDMALCSYMLTITGTATASVEVFLGAPGYGAWFPVILDATANATDTSNYANMKARLRVSSYTSGTVSLHVHGVRG